MAGGGMANDAFKRLRENRANRRSVRNRHLKFKVDDTTSWEGIEIKSKELSPAERWNMKNKVFRDTRRKRDINIALALAAFLVLTFLFIYLLLPFV